MMDLHISLEIKTLLEEAINQGKAFELLGKSMRIITRKQTKQIIVHHTRLIEVNEPCE